MITQRTDGILLFDKNNNCTSFQALYKIRKALNIKKIGHAGTLDKNATGLLIVGIGKATKLLKFFIKQPKKYRAEISFGKQTTTDDISGQIINEYRGEITLEKIKSCLPQYIGKIRQIPPDFSSVHINGERAYRIALKNTKPELTSREIEINYLQVIHFNNPVLTLEIDCSSGTYIRSLARDLGIATGYYAHLSALRRLSIGDFLLENAVTLEQIENQNYSLMTPYQALSQFGSLAIKNNFNKQILQGQPIIDEWIDTNLSQKMTSGQYYRIHENEELLAVIKYNNGRYVYDFVY